MTYDEADKIAAIIATADSGCPSCVGDMCEQFNEAFPAFVWEMDKTRYFVTVRPASEATP